MSDLPDAPRAAIDTLVDGSIPAGGLVVRSFDDDECFVDVAVALRLIATPVITPVPGTSEPIVGAAFVDDEILAVVRAGGAVGTCLLCSVDGEHVVVQGLEVLRVARSGDAQLPRLDVRALVAARPADDAESSSVASG